MRVCMLSMEILDPIFSGNGVASRSVARAFTGSQDELLVLCGRPQGQYEEVELVDSELAAAVLGVREASSHLKGVSVALPKWGKTDRNSAYKEYAIGLLSAQAIEAIETFNADVYLCVDWTGAQALRSIRQNPRIPTRPILFFCFCVFSSLFSNTAEDTDFYSEMEGQSMDDSHITLVLGAGDVTRLRKLRPEANVEIAVPPLRKDLHERLLQPATEKKRKYVTCCLRLVAAKNVLVFCEAISILASWLDSQGLVPVLCGASGDAEYAAKCKKVLSEGCDNAVILDFLPANELASLLQETVINIHTAPYEAYGMTIIEAAGAGAVPMIHSKWEDIGATQLLADDEFHSFFVADMLSADALASKIRCTLSDPDKVRSTAERARAKALAWGEEQFGAHVRKAIATIDQAEVKQESNANAA